ncbi:hypothetical protein KIL84_005575 [Mauremys mutica]|uniref:Uncharacterized protein n=1 Tax=Mauremys mutica TaxID=74926 RepID=A0A9D3XI75_9SAUR|nr:hypothetical protein KIL84_005575 [Mauremys mutica]
MGRCMVLRLPYTQGSLPLAHSWCWQEAQGDKTQCHECVEVLLESPSFMLPVTPVLHRLHPPYPGLGSRAHARVSSRCSHILRLHMEKRLLGDSWQGRLFALHSSCLFCPVAPLPGCLDAELWLPGPVSLQFSQPGCSAGMSSWRYLQDRSSSAVDSDSLTSASAHMPVFTVQPPGWGGHLLGNHAQHALGHCYNPQHQRAEVPTQCHALPWAQLARPIGLRMPVMGTFPGHDIHPPLLVPLASQAYMW